MADEQHVITAKLHAFIARQPMFFVATATAEGRINLSPKGVEGCFHVIDERRVAFLNLTGSGNETAAHLSGNPRITVMFCAFSGKPLILRLYGRGRAIHRRDADWAQFELMFPRYPGMRQIVVIDVDNVMTSCGFGVPEMTLTGQRDQLNDWALKKGEDGIRDYWEEKNKVSLDGLPTAILDKTLP
jgi:hypothetical protein